MSCSVVSTLIRPGSAGRCKSSRHVRERAPEKRSRTVKARPPISSHSSRWSWMRSGAASASPRRTSFNVRRAPGSTRKAGSARHCAGRSVRDGSTGCSPDSSTCRSGSLAAKTQTSRSGHGSSRGDRARMFGLPSTRATTVTANVPARTWIRSRPASSMRAGRSPATATTVVPGSSAPMSSISRAFPDTSRLKRVSTHIGMPSVTRRKAWRRRLSALAADSPSVRSQTRPASSLRGSGTRRPATARSTSARRAGTGRESGRCVHTNRPSIRCEPAGRRNAGPSSRSITAAGRPSIRTSCGQRWASPGRRRSRARSA